jgi:hypothetical protein
MRAIASRTPRRLARRIQRFLDELNRQGREPNRLEGHHLLDALAHLSGGECQLGEEAMERAEQASRPDEGQLRPVRPSFDPVTVARLREHLNSIKPHHSSLAGDGADGSVP